MNWYYYIALALLISQLVFLVQMYRNFRYVLSKYKRPRTWYRPKTALIVPCKGKDIDFEKNITSFYNQDYQQYILYFVVAETSDPAYDQLCELKEKLISSTKAADVRILIAGHGTSCSQKIHNLLHAYKNIPDDIEALAFADSDACIRPDWLSHIVYPLRHPKKRCRKRIPMVRPENKQPCDPRTVRGQCKDRSTARQLSLQPGMGRFNGDQNRRIQKHWTRQDMEKRTKR